MAAAQRAQQAGTLPKACVTGHTFALLTPSFRGTLDLKGGSARKRRPKPSPYREDFITGVTNCSEV